jgi:hypothetical protein
MISVYLKNYVSYIYIYIYIFEHLKFGMYVLEILLRKLIWLSGKIEIIPIIFFSYPFLYAEFPIVVFHCSLPLN